MIYDNFFFLILELCLLTVLLEFLNSSFEFNICTSFGIFFIFVQFVMALIPLENDFFYLIKLIFSILIYIYMYFLIRKVKNKEKDSLEKKFLEMDNQLSKIITKIKKTKTKVKEIFKEQKELTIYNKREAIKEQLYRKQLLSDISEISSNIKNLFKKNEENDNNDQNYY